MTLLCDSGARYASKLFNPAFLRSKNLPVPEWLEAKARAPKVLSNDRDALPEDAYQAEAEAVVRPSRAELRSTTVFYPQGGGQSGDRGDARARGRGRLPIVNTVYDADRATILHVPPKAPPSPARRGRAPASTGTALQRMRAHTALHLLSVVLPYPVTGGSVGDAEGRLDFDSGDAALDKARSSAGSTS